MASTLALKPSAKATWDQLESSRLGSDRARISSVQRLHKRYENISFLDSESLDDFVLRLAKIVHKLEILGDTEEPCKVTLKYLCVCPEEVCFHCRLN
jgi:hypothetical protein